MTRLPDRDEQIRLAHAEFIHQIVKACQNIEEQSQLKPMLEHAESSGWTTLVERIREIIKGRRDEALLNGLDEEDTVIIRSILLGLQDPSTLPEIKKDADPTMAAPGIAHMIHAASRGDAQALQGISFMAEQMVNTQGDMRLLGGIIHKLLNGERDPDKLCKGMTTHGEHLVLGILDELNRMALQ